jgi:hypothetical protein
MMRRMAGLFLCFLTLVSLQVQASSSLSVCSSPAACCSAGSTSCCESSPIDCCVETPDRGTHFLIPQHLGSVGIPLLGEVEAASSAHAVSLVSNLLPARIIGPDPPLPTGRALLTLWQSYLI